MNTAWNETWFVLLLIVAALLLTLAPLPAPALFWRPQWDLLAVFFWCIFLSRRAGIVAAWFLGLLIDVQTGGLLGERALLLAAAALLIQRQQIRLRLFPLHQQTLLLLPIAALLLLIEYLFRALSGAPPVTPLYWAPLSTTPLFWPPFSLLLGGLQRRFGIRPPMDKQAP